MQPPDAYLICPSSPLQHAPDRCAEPRGPVATHGCRPSRNQLRDLPQFSDAVMGGDVTEGVVHIVTFNAARTAWLHRRGRHPDPRTARGRPEAGGTSRVCLTGYLFPKRAASPLLPLTQSLPPETRVSRAPLIVRGGPASTRQCYGRIGGTHKLLSLEAIS